VLKQRPEPEALLPIGIEHAIAPCEGKKEDVRFLRQPERTRGHLRNPILLVIPKPAVLQPKREPALSGAEGDLRAIATCPALVTLNTRNPPNELNI